MKRIGFDALTLIVGAALFTMTPARSAAQTKEPPGGRYKEACKLVQLPCFLPSLGTLYVDPSTMPRGPWLGYDKKGKLVNELYMVPIKDMQNHMSWDDLKVGKGGRVNHVSILFNPGHPGMGEPHYHIILWYISPEQVKALK